MTEQSTPDEQASKDEFFKRIADLSQEMTAVHGEDFTIGALILGARYIAEKKVKPEEAERK
ncbi:hypothetical protein JL100_032475 (plasmid) [Skermanella mucosa]|uniref:hypothetical protein n=1 Tax=Skermanella mucosa TaxID=1789672 RepID=UPI00192BD77E|nr:hypothetical protein [Skermanella mucosa]UEM24344.1 hypothetical protein JL100_032475 [Skermanella mucosa]